MLSSVVVSVLAAALVQAAQAPFDASKVALSTPVVLTSFSGAEVKGFPLRLSWSPDGRQLHLRVVQRDRWANEKEWHYLVSVADGKLSPADAEPGWSTGYWYLKSVFECPGVPGLKFDIESRTQRISATNAGAGGSIAQNSGDPYGAGFDLGPQGQAVLSGAQQSQNVTTTTMRLKGQVVSEFVNTQVIAGLLYGWGPEGAGAIAYGNTKRVLVVMDQHGGRQELKGTKGVLLPAWSPDGARLAWIEQVKRGRYVLKFCGVTRR
jgi:hypothetical protein